MSQLYTAFETYLQKENMHFQGNDDDNITLKMSCDNSDFTVSARFYDQYLQIYTYNPYKVPENKRAAVSEYLTRANYNLRVGNFEFDLSDGEVRYKTSMKWMEDYMPGDDTLEFLFSINFSIMDKYFPGLNAVVYGGVDPKQAVEDVEK